MQHIHPITGPQSVLERTGRRNKITRKAAQIPSRQFVYKFFLCLLKKRTVNNGWNEKSSKCSRVKLGRWRGWRGGIILTLCTAAAVNMKTT